MHIEKGPAVGHEVSKRYFYLINEHNWQVLEVPRNHPSPGTTVSVEKRRGDNPAHQLWYLDVSGVIRCKISDLALHAKESGDKIRVVCYTGDVRQKWVIRGNRIVNEMFSDECLGLKKEHRDDVISSHYKGKPYQHWKVEYV